MTFFSQFDEYRRKAELQRDGALVAWRLKNPDMMNSGSHIAAFMAGYEAAAGPLPPTGKEIAAKFAQQIVADADQKRQRIAALPPGTCPDCEGEGSFVGSTHITDCTTCNATGRVSPGGGEK